MSKQWAEETARRFSFGKGGAGNIRKATPEPPTADALRTPELKGKNYSTGRGGSGNMAKNDPAKPDVARKHQDVDIPAVKLQEDQQHTGRGGVANTYRPSEEEVQAAREHNEKVRASSTSSNEKPTGIANLAKKGKEVLSGQKE